ncbi:GNAT family N-acetyltransferase [Jiangella sp. DSM 45060]|uniref:GNAT family N-acetyltransferase n=1 Tax=Jiangella sp. DSM 45060 TaxID=1798224 RepID=UPI00087CCE66|nr:GNAT family N-acetyltransferase [Jiangella sp. DSM 45060]SDS17341.1 Protein N-acetyltransferase, RimJ/RimL family [Jiangella sp. DSM 45060]
MQPFELRAERLLLAVPVAADIERITELCQDPEIQRWTTLPSPYTHDHAKSFVEDAVRRGWETEQDLVWAIRSPEDRRIHGVIGLRSHGDGAAEVGYWVGSEARGDRLVSRAVRLVAEYAFADVGLGLTHLRWRAIVGNWASRRVAWACGFRIEGLIRGGNAQRGVRRDTWVGTLMAGEPMRPVSPWLDVPTLRGSRVALRRFADSDAAAVVEACNDPVTQHWLGGLPSPYTRDIARAYIRDREEEAAAGRGVHWAAALPEGGPAIGAFSLMGLLTHDGGAEIGYWVHPAARGRGVATEAVGLMARHAFAPVPSGGLGLRRLVIAHVTGNDGSRKVIERAGFRPYGVERAGDRIRGGTVLDLHWYDLLSDDPLPRSSGSLPPDEPLL